MGNQKRKAEAERRRRQRKRLLMIGGVVVLIAALVAGYLLFIYEEAPPVEASANEADVFAGGSTSLLYADFDGAKDLHLLDLDSEKDEITGELPREGNVEAAPGSTWLSIQLIEAGEGDTSEPVIYAYDPDSDQETRIGVGYDPAWSPDGRLLAWNKPEDPTRCVEAECKGDISVQVTDIASGSTDTLVEPGAYGVVGWAGDHVIVQDDSTPTNPVLQAVSPEGEQHQLPIRPIDYWGASPDGRWLVQSGESRSMFFEMVDGEVMDEGVPITIRDGTRLGAGTWAHDSSRVAAFAAGEDNSLVLVTFRPNAPDPVVLTEGGQASTGIVLWSPENDAVVFQRFNGDELEAVHCPLEGDCTTLFSWTKGKALLRIE